MGEGESGVKMSAVRDAASLEAVGNLTDRYVYSHLYGSIEVGVVGAVRGKSKLHIIYELS